MSDQEIADDLAKAWAQFLMKTATQWVFNCDSGCFSETCDREAWTNTHILAIYQPHKSMREYDDMYASVFFKRTDKKPLTAKIIKLANLEHLNKLMLGSYNDILAKTNNKWTHKIDGSFSQLIQIIKEPQLEKGTYKLTFEIRGATNWCCGDSWWPHRLNEWQGGSNEMTDDEDFFQKCIMDAKPAIIE